MKAIPRLNVTERSSRWIETRPSLLSRLKSWEDNDSWRVFFDNYSNLIYWAAKRCGLSEADAEDIVQKVVIVVCKNIANFRYDPDCGSFKGWLLRITQNQVRDFKRQQMRENNFVTQNLDRVLEEIPDTTSQTMSDIWDAEWEQNLWETALENLKLKVSVREYQIFDAFALQKWKVWKVAEVFGVSIPNAHVIKHRMKVRLKQEYKAMQSKTFKDLTVTKLNNALL